MDGPFTYLEATVETYQFRSYGGEQQDRQVDRAANRCADMEATVGPVSYAPMAAAASGNMKKKLIIILYIENDLYISIQKEMLGIKQRQNTKLHNK